MRVFILSLGFSVLTSQLIAGEKIGIYSYNVLNLFNAVHDEGTNDYEYLPISLGAIKQEGCRRMYEELQDETRSDADRERAIAKCQKNDWTEELYRSKLKNISYALSVSKEKSNTPLDVLGLVEIENTDVIKELADAAPISSPLVFTTDRGDYRGIRNGLIVRGDHPDLKGCEKMEDIEVKILKSMAEDLSLRESDRKTILKTEDGKVISRKILEVKCSVGPDTIYYYVNHWPAAYHPTFERIAAAIALRTRIQERLQSGDKDHVKYIAMGDFNTREKYDAEKIKDKDDSRYENIDIPKPVADYLIKPDQNQDSIDSSNIYLDFIEQFRASNDKTLSSRANWLALNGTYFYNGDSIWNQFDLFIGSVPRDPKKGSNGWTIDLQSFRVHHHDELGYFPKSTGSKGRKNNGDSRRQNGKPKDDQPSDDEDQPERVKPDYDYSDHYPVSVEMVYELK